MRQLRDESPVPDRRLMGRMGERLDTRITDAPAGAALLPGSSIANPSLDSGPTESSNAFAAAHVSPRWLVNPMVDLLFCCGGAVWLAAWLYEWGLRNFYAETSTFLAINLVFLTHLLSNPHTSATWVRIYGDRGEYRRFRFYSVWIALAMIALAAASLYLPGWPEALANLYLLWVVVHYNAQVYGIAMLYCGRWGYRFTDRERLIFKWTLLFAAYFAIARKLTLPEYHTYQFLGLQMPYWGPLPEPVLMVSQALWLSTSALFLYILVDKFFRQGVLPPLPMVLLVVSGLCFTLLSGTFMSAVWIFVPPFFHGSQYLLVSGTFHFGKKRREEPGVGHRLLSSQGLLYWLLLVMIGHFIYKGFPTILSESGINYTLGMAVTFAVVNFHHFLTDAAIWRLRDPKIREVLMYG